MVQCDVAFGKPAENASATINALDANADHDLCVFPECGLTGYCVDSHEEASSLALSYEKGVLPGAGMPIADACREKGIHAIIGFAGLRDDKLRNVAALLTPEGNVHLYEKTHLPWLGYDRFVEPGDSLPVFETSIGRIGLQICFDLRFPEVTRALVLQGADIVALPTNWPVGAEVSAELLAPARAAENHCYLLAANRVGTENGTPFIGTSGIYGPGGATLQRAGEAPAVLTAELDLARARDKHMKPRPGEYEWTVLESRRPELYGPITGTNSSADRP